MKRKTKNTLCGFLIRAKKWINSQRRAPLCTCPDRAVSHLYKSREQNYNVATNACKKMAYVIFSSQLARDYPNKAMMWAHLHI